MSGPPKDGITAKIEQRIDEMLDDMGDAPPHDKAKLADAIESLQRARNAGLTGAADLPTIMAQFMADQLKSESTTETK